MGDTDHSLNPCIFFAIAVRQMKDPGIIVRTLHKLNFAEGTFGPLVMVHQANTKSTRTTSPIIGPRLLATYEYKGTLKEAIFIDGEPCQHYQFPEQTLLDAGVGKLFRADDKIPVEPYRHNLNRVLAKILASNSKQSLQLLLMCYLFAAMDGNLALTLAMECRSKRTRSSCQELTSSNSRHSAALQSACMTLQLFHVTFRTDALSFTDRDSPAPRACYPNLALLRDSTINNITGSTRKALTSNVANEYVCVVPLRLDPGPDNGIGLVTFELSKNTIHLKRSRDIKFLAFQPSFNCHTRAVSVQRADSPKQWHLAALEIDDEDLATTQTSVTQSVAFPRPPVGYKRVC
ncbi:hypothetical protein BJ138DRAFT_1161643 [Hygrophoropsis aurantiaca]|uniref:Uncharacterized protein n=1 Tax=Hygrophoropsis aurantiaca TaxID=72124 RepID=A0ACB8A0Z4_9AGAM|nr:hypothetical protein BJ138DRAFT_1161643 [Hygrophoropsis aurantiaca]